MNVSPLFFIDLPSAEKDERLFDINLDPPDGEIDRYAIEAADLREEMIRCEKNKLAAYEAIIEKDLAAAGAGGVTDAEDIKLAKEACLFILTRPIKRPDEEVYKKAFKTTAKRIEEKEKKI